MKSAHESSSLLRNRLFRNGLISTLLALVACLLTHLVTLLGIVGAVAWLGTLEHALVAAVVGLGALTAYAAYRHGRGCAKGEPKP